MKLIIVILFLISLVILYLWWENSRFPKNLGVHNGHLAPCPNRPSCVSSESKEERHFVPPLSTAGVENPMEELIKILLNKEKATLVKENPSYLHVEFRSPIFNFVDDAEFYYDKERDLIEVRSVARVGYYDFDVNKKRIEEIQREFQKSSTL